MTMYDRSPMNPKAMFILTGTGEKAAPVEAHLWVCSGKNIGRRFALDKAEQLIGRSPEIEIPVLDERVSQQHAKIVVRDARHWVLDLGSTNGTFVNNERVNEAKLRDGDLIQVGETVFEYLSYEERNLTITLRGTDRDSDAVPAALRAGAQQLLRQARDSVPEIPVPPLASLPPGGSGLPPPGGSSTVDIAAEAPSPLPMHRPAKNMGHVGHVGGHLGPMGPAVESRRGLVLEHEDEDEDEEGGGLNLQDIILKVRAGIAFFLPYWRSICALMVLGIVIGVATFLLRPPVKKASFELSLNPAAQENPLSGSRNSTQFFRSAEQSFRSSSLIERTLMELGVPSVTPAMVSGIQKRLEFASVGPPTPNTYKGSYVSGNMEDPVNFLETHVRIFLESEIDKTLRVLRTQVDFLSEQLAETDKELKRTETEVTEFKKANIDGLPEQARNYYDLLFQLQQAQSSVASEVYKTQQEKDLGKTKLRETPALINTREHSVQHFNEAIAATMKDLASARAAGKGPEHPDVTRMERQLQELKREQKKGLGMTEVVRGRNQAYDEIEHEVRRVEVAERVARAEAGRLAREIERVRAVVTRLPELEAVYSDLNRNYEATRSLHATLFEHWKAMQLQLEMEKAAAGARFDQISPPALEFISQSKMIAVRTIIGAFAGLFLGLAFAALRRLRKSPVFTMALAPIRVQED